MSTLTRLCHSLSVLFSPAASRISHLPLDYGIPLFSFFSLSASACCFSTRRRQPIVSSIQPRAGFVCPAVSLMEPFLGISRSALGTHSPVLLLRRPSSGLDRSPPPSPFPLPRSFRSRRSSYPRVSTASPFVTSTILRRDVRRVKRRRSHLCTCNDGLPGSRPSHNGVNQEILAPPFLARARALLLIPRLYTLVFSSRLKAPHSLHRRQSRTRRSFRTRRFARQMVRTMF